jgi:WhiB family redox-sensing transcriptional regulator
MWGDSVLTPPEWQKRAACRDEDSRLFTDPEKGRVPVAALRICVACDVRNDCLRWALGLPSGQDLGILGGTTEGARRRIRNRTSTPTAAMARGDAMARLRSRTEQLADEEPWLLQEGIA